MSKSLLLKAIRKLSEVQSRNKILRKKFMRGGEIAVITEIENKIKIGSIDLETIKCFLDLILISNKPSIFEKYSLQDLKAFFRSLCKIYPDDVEINVEYYHFLFNVLDEEKKAIKHLEEFSNRVIKKINPQG